MARQPNEIQAADQRRQIVALMLAGARQMDVVRTLNLDKATVTREIREIRAEWRADQNCGYEALVAIEAARLERLQMAHWQRAIDGSINHTDIIIKLMDRRIKLLGLDAPERHRVELTQGTALEDVTTRLAQLAAQYPVSTESEEDTEGDISS